MNFGEMIYTIIIGPLQLFFEVVFMMVNHVVDNPGWSIVVLSLAMNILVLPLYRRADAMQEEQRNIENKLRAGVSHIRKTFKGDEKMMILQTYYRQNHYKPTDVFKGSVSLLLEIPFFIAAYQFLSHLELLQGASFGVIDNLGARDALLQIGDISINILPIFMTGINLISCLIFTDGYPLKTKIQLYGMALFFFVFLYNSPAGLVFYWTLNNLFSLVKTLCYKIKLPGKKWARSLRMKPLRLQSNRKVFWAGAFFLTLLIGVIIPSAVIKSSPQEFIDVQFYLNPLWFVCNSLCLAIGTFILWFGVFYMLASPKIKILFEAGIWLLCGIATVNYLFFGKNLGLLNSALQYENEMHFEGTEIIVNLLVLTGVVVAMLFLYKFAGKIIPQVLFIASAAFILMAGWNIYSIANTISQGTETIAKSSQTEKVFQLSKTGNNVVVFMLDRGMNLYIPYFLQEKPELKQIYSGFTYYPNTLSFGLCTNIASPALYGGYEYTPEEINKRDTESLCDKQVEALKVMPVLFSENGYQVTVCDPTYANYQWIPDVSIYDDYDGIKACNTMGHYTDIKSTERRIQNNKRNFFCYSMMKSSPLLLQFVLYDDGRYNSGSANPATADVQMTLGNYIADGISKDFMKSYTVLQNLSAITDITEENVNTFLMISNDTTHEPTMLQEPDYSVSLHVDNKDYEKKNADRYTVDGVTLEMADAKQYMHYQSNMAALLEIGKWITYMKENDVYDNTRIILVADHGAGLQQVEGMLLDAGSETEDISSFYPLLFVKDFGSEEFSVSEEFMTNGDVPSIAFEGIINHPINPFTGKEITNSRKNTNELYVFGSDEWYTATNNGNVFLPGIWFTVHDDMRDADNWSVVQEWSTSPFEKKE